MRTSTERALADKRAKRKAKDRLTTNWARWYRQEKYVPCEAMVGKNATQHGTDAKQAPNAKMPEFKRRTLTDLTKLHGE